MDEWDALVSLDFFPLACKPVISSPSTVTIVLRTVSAPDERVDVSNRSCRSGTGELRWGGGLDEGGEGAHRSLLQSSSGPRSQK